MSSVSIKISKHVAQAAREAAKLADRSLTGQVEHWVRLGIQAEEKLTGSALRVFKHGADATAKPSDLAEIDALMDQLAIPGRATESALVSRMLEGETLYALDDENEDILIEISPEGKRRRGTLIDRKFLPFPE